MIARNSRFSFGCWGYYSLETNKGDVLSFNITADEDEFTDDTMICYMGMESQFDSLAFRKISYGEKVKVTDGPFNGFSGTVEEILEDRSKVKVIVVIFGRKTLLELSFTQVTKE